MTDALSKALRDGAKNELPEPETSVAPSSTARSRLLGAIDLGGRFDRFDAITAELLDIPASRAKGLLDRIDTEGVFTEELPGVDFFWLPGGPKAQGAIRGFVRVKAEAQLPEHEHLGQEEVLVMQGVYIDSRTGERFPPGSRISGGQGTTHEFHPDSAAVDLLMLIVVHGGYRIGEMHFAPRDVPDFDLDD